MAKIEFIEKQTEILAEMYKEITAVRFLANFNGIVFGLLVFYFLMIGVGGAPLVIVFCMFIVNSVFFFSKWYKDNQRGKK